VTLLMRKSPATSRPDSTPEPLILNFVVPYAVSAGFATYVKALEMMTLAKSRQIVFVRERARHSRAQWVCSDSRSTPPTSCRRG